MQTKIVGFTKTINDWQQGGVYQMDESLLLSLKAGLGDDVCRNLTPLPLVQAVRQANARLGAGLANAH